MQPITLSINPSYHCNFRCDFCYLTPAQLRDHKRLEPEVLDRRLTELQESGFQVKHVDLYGGEIGLLPVDYLESLDSVLEAHGNPTMGLNTNLSRVHPYFLRSHVNLSVSFDFEARQSSDLVLQNILSLPRRISILLLASPRLMAMDIDRMIRTLNSIANVEAVEIKPYSRNQSNQLNATFRDYEIFVQKWLVSGVPMRFEFTNRRLIEESLSGSRNAYSDDHLYITPEGRFAVLEFDHQDREYFLSLSSAEEYRRWAAREKTAVGSNEVCRSCKYQGSCLTEHYRIASPSDTSCSGFRGLLDWYQGLPE
jgi:pyruvate-formate lyase-activating enzyme